MNNQNTNNHQQVNYQSVNVVNGQVSKKDHIHSNEASGNKFFKINTYNNVTVSHTNTEKPDDVPHLKSTRSKNPNELDKYYSKLRDNNNTSSRKEREHLNSSGLSYPKTKKSSVDRKTMTKQESAFFNKLLNKTPSKINIAQIQTKQLVHSRSQVGGIGTNENSIHTANLSSKSKNPGSKNTMNVNFIQNILSGGISFQSEASRLNSKSKNKEKSLGLDKTGKNVGKGASIVSSINHNTILRNNFSQKKFSQITSTDARAKSALNDRRK